MDCDSSCSTRSPSRCAECATSFLEKRGCDENGRVMSGGSRSNRVFVNPAGSRQQVFEENLISLSLVGPRERIFFPKAITVV